MRVRLNYTDTITIDLEVSSVRWTAPGAHEFGTADFVIPRAHPALSYNALGSYLRPGGGSLIEIETPSLGLWRGVASNPVWSKAGVQVHAMHVSYLMQLRLVARSRIFVGMTAGTIFRMAVLNAIEGIGVQVLRVGTFLEAAPVIPRYEFRGQDLAQVAVDLNQMTGQEFRIGDDGTISWVPPRGSLYAGFLCDDGDVADVVKTIQGTEQAMEFIARANDGNEYIARGGSDSLLRRQQLVGVNTTAAGAAGLAAEQALAGARSTPATYTARLKDGRTTTASWSGAVKTDNPAGWWRMDELSGTNLLDSSGNANTAAMTGSPTLGVAGLVAGSADPAVRFNGSTQYATAADAVSLDIGDTFAIEAVIARSALNVAGTIVDKGAGAYRLTINAANLVEFSSPGGTVLATSSVAINDFLPHHIVALKFLSITTSIYVDGRDVTVLGTDTTCADNAVSLYIGATGGASSFFAGTIDEVALYKGSTATSAILTHILTHYEAFHGGHHVNIREGDYLRLISSYTAPGGETPLVRVMGRTASDNDPYESLQLQFIDPIDASTSLRLIGDLGTMGPPPAIIQDQTSVTQIMTILKDDFAKLQVQVAAIQLKV